MVLCVDSDLEVQFAEETGSATVSPGFVFRLHEDAPNNFICYFHGKQCLFPTDTLKTLDEALVYFTEACESNPTCEYFALKANLEERQGNFEQAFSDIEKAYEFDPDNYRAKLIHAGIHFTLEQYDEAGQLADEVIDGEDVEPRTLGGAHSTKASVLSRSNEYADGLEHITKAIEIYSLAAQFHANRGYFLKMNDQLDEAVKEFNRAIELNPSSPYGYFRVGYESWSDDKHDEALPYFKKSVELDPRYYYPNYYLARIYKQKGEQTDYVKYLCQAAQAMKPKGYTLSECAWLLATHPNETFRNPKLAKQLSEQLIENFEGPTDQSRGYHSLTAAWLQMGEFEKAEEALDAASSPHADATIQENLSQAIEDKVAFIDEEIMDR